MLGQLKEIARNVAVLNTGAERSAASNREVVSLNLDVAASVEQMTTTAKTTIAASGSGYLSPARCWSAPAPASPSPTGSFRITAPWSRSPGRGNASRPAKYQPNQHLEMSSRP
jgi:hypothetical protein